VKSPRNYSCIILPIGKANEAAQLNLDHDYRILTRTGQAKKPHLIWTYLDPSPHERKKDERLFHERTILADHRDEKGWLALLQSK
ncbi:MAG: hypothetical protein WAV02_12725, partial [Stellaceae bacterium]